MLESLFNEAADPQASNFIKKRVQYLCFPLKLVKFVYEQFILQKTCCFCSCFWLLLWFLQQNNVTFSVITKTLSAKIISKDYHGNTVIIITLACIKISIFYQMEGHLVQKFCSLSRRSANFMTAFIISIFQYF